MRKLATIRRIDELNPIPGADAIECAVVGGWKVVAQKGLYNVGDLAVYFEIDSWIPSTIAPFLSKGKEPREFEGVKGERLRTIKLRGQLSQGLLMPIREVEAFKSFSVGDDDSFDLCPELDVTDLLGIKKWEKAIPAQLAGVCRGNFPTEIPKTDQERVQNLKKEIEGATGSVYEVTEKLEGSSCTMYLKHGEFGVCSRNLDLKETDTNSFWIAARKYEVEAKMRAIDEFWDFAIQGELIGPGIQGNIYKLTDIEFHVFDVYDIQNGKYLNPKDRRELVQRMGLTHVPVIAEEFVLDNTIDQLLTLAEGHSTLFKAEREGIVFKEVNGGMTFKAISNRYLCNEKD